MYLFWTRKMVEGGTKLDIQIRKEVLSAKIESAKSGGGEESFQEQSCSKHKKHFFIDNSEKEKKNDKQIKETRLRNTVTWLQRSPFYDPAKYPTDTVLAIRIGDCFTEKAATAVCSKPGTCFYQTADQFQANDGHGAKR